MKLKEIYEFVVKKGLEKDPRSKKEIKDALGKTKRCFRKLPRLDKKFFDKEALKHPFSDTRILSGNPSSDIRTIMVGIDIGGEELLTAYTLNREGLAIDLAMSHHPSGRALTGLYNVMSVQANMLEKLGVRHEIAEDIVTKRMQEVMRRFSSLNTERAIDIARLLDIPLMCVHTPADNHVNKFLQDLFDREKPKKINDALNILKSIPEYQDGMVKGAGPRVVSGEEKKICGRVFVDMTGGTEGSKKVFSRLSQAGVNTVVGMHFSEEHIKIAKSEYVNVIVAGHIASDNLGLNLLLDELSKKERLNIMPCSGFMRVKRK